MRELLRHVVVVSQIGLCSDEDERHAWRVMLNLRPPLRLDVVERSGRNDAETDQEDVGLRVTQRTQSILKSMRIEFRQMREKRCKCQNDDLDSAQCKFPSFAALHAPECSTDVVFLSSCIPESEVDRLSVDHDVRAVVVEDCRNVLTGERIRGVRNQETRLSDGSVSDDDTLDVLPVEREKSNGERRNSEVSRRFQQQVKYAQMRHADREWRQKVR